MISAFNDNLDIHSSTASKVFNVEIKNVTKEQRSNAKTVNFGIIYGVSAFGLSNQTDLSRSESKDLIESYFKAYPQLKNYISNQINFARENGYVETILGRRRYLKDINSRNPIVRGGAERNAVNAPVQGSAADIIKIAMVKISDKIKLNNFKSKMLVQVHDELIFEIYKPELQKMKELIKKEMESVFTLNVPLTVDIGIGENWHEAH
jgi:DNA polymerase-1